MISKNNRIPKKTIEEIMKEKKSTNCDFFLLKYKKNEENKPRFCVIAPKKIFKTAVERNKVKRFLKNKIQKKEIKFDKNLDYVLIAKKEIKNSL